MRFVNEYALAFELLEAIESNQAGKINTFSLTFSKGLDQAKLETAISQYVKLWQPTIADSRLFNYSLQLLNNGRIKYTFHFHHSVSDATTVRHFIRLLAELYNGMTLGPKQVTSHINNDNTLFDYDLKTDAKYWQNLLSKQNITVQFPVASSKKGFKSVHFSTNATLTEQIKSLLKQHKTSLFVFISSVFSIALSRYTNQQEFCLIYPVDMRPMAEKHLLGCYINSVFMTCKLHDNISFIDLLAKVKAERKQSKLHQKSPFYKIIQQLREENIIQSEVNANVTIAESLLSYQPEVPFSDAKCTYKWEPSDINGDMVLIYDASSDNIKFRLDCKNRLPSYFHQQFTQDFLRLLAFFSTHPTTLIHQAPMMDPDTLQTVIDKWNRTRVLLPTNIRSVHQHFEQQVNQSPEQIALIMNHATLSYRALNQHANKIANIILSHTKSNPQPSIIPICADKSFELIAGILAILKSGHAYLPIDPNWPEEKIRDILQDSNATVIIAQEQYNAKFKQLITINLDKKLDCKDSNPNIRLPHDALAYVMYTSGSTGRPKGVMVQHNNLINHLAWIQDTYQLTMQDRVLHKTPNTFDVSVWEILWPLSYGASIVLAPTGAHSNPDKLRDIIKNHQVTTLHFVGSFASIFTKYAAKHVTDLMSVKRLFLGGELIQASLKKRCSTIFKQAQLSVFYGPTETTIESVTSIINHANIKINGHIGRPIANTSCYILDEYMSPVPIGVSGELYIGGMGVTRGYLNKPELSKDRFITNPFASEQEKAEGYNLRLYKTGDIVKWLANGHIQYIGRKDFQIKLRGQRIELSEIEATLLRHTAIIQAVVNVQGEHENCHLIAYYTSRAGCLDSSELQALLSLYLPEYMVPHIYVYLKEMPLSNNGKIDRNALPLASMNKYDNSPPSSPTELKIAKLWKKVTGREVNDRHISFFVSGGHSLAAIQLISEINKVFHSNFSARFIFEHKTLSEQAKIIDETKSSKYHAIKPLRLAQSADKNIFIIHPSIAGGEVYEHIITALPDNYNIYALDSYNLHHINRPIKSIRELASYYLTAIREIQAQGPYNFAGWSLGGLIAYEIVLQLASGGHKTEKLLLLDSIVLGNIDRALLERYHKLSYDQKMQELHSLGLSKKELNKYGKLLGIEQKAMLNYKPKPYHGSVTLLNARDNHQFLQRLDQHTEIQQTLHELKMNANGWKPYLNNLNEISVDASHYSIIKDHSTLNIIKTIFNN